MLALVSVCVWSSLCSKLGMLMVSSSHTTLSASEPVYVVVQDHRQLVSWPSSTQLYLGWAHFWQLGHCVVAWPLGCVLCPDLFTLALSKNAGLASPALASTPSQAFQYSLLILYESSVANRLWLVIEP